MSNWYYYNKNGEKIGPISVSALKELTQQGLITRETVIENQGGRSSTAGQINGLTFPDAASPDKGRVAPPATGEIYGVSSPSVPTRPAGMAIEIFLNGMTRTVTQQEFFNLAAQGIINPQTPVRINGTPGTAGNVRGIVFGQPRTMGEPNPFAQSAVAPANTGFTPLPQQPFQQGAVPGYSAFTGGQAHAPASGYDYKSIAAAHRLATWSILVFILSHSITRWLYAVDLDSVRDGIVRLQDGIFLAVLSLVVGFSSHCMVRLAKLLHFKVGTIVVLAICLPLPLLCLIPLFTVYIRAGKVLKQAGYKVGFIGVNMQRFNGVPVIERAKAPHWIAAVSITVTLLMVYGIVTTQANKINRAYDKIVASEEERKQEADAEDRRTRESLARKLEPIAEAGRKQESDAEEREVQEFVSKMPPVPLRNTYRNNEIGFSFRYPGDWQEIPLTTSEIMEGFCVKATGQPKKDGSSPNLRVVLTEGGDETVFKASKVKFQASLESRFRNVSIKDFGIKTINGKKFLFHHSQVTMGEALHLEMLQLFFLHTDKTLVVTIADGPTNFGKNRAVFDSIISSFKFD